MFFERAAPLASTETRNGGLEATAFSLCSVRLLFQRIATGNASRWQAVTGRLRSNKLATALQGRRFVISRSNITNRRALYRAERGSSGGPVRLAGE